MATTRSFIHSREVRELMTTMVFGDTGSNTLVFSLPANARIIAFILNVKTAFDAGNAQLDIGVLDSYASIVSNASIGTVGQTVPSTEVVVPGYETSVVTPIYYTVDATAATAGEVDVMCLFSLQKGTKLN